MSLLCDGLSSCRHLGVDRLALQSQFVKLATTQRVQLFLSALAGGLGDLVAVAKLLLFRRASLVPRCTLVLESRPLGIELLVQLAANCRSFRIELHLDGAAVFVVFAAAFFELFCDGPPFFVKSQPRLLQSQPFDLQLAIDNRTEIGPLRGHLVPEAENQSLLLLQLAHERLASTDLLFQLVFAGLEVRLPLEHLLFELVDPEAGAAPFLIEEGVLLLQSLFSPFELVTLGAGDGRRSGSSPGGPPLRVAKSSRSAAGRTERLRADSLATRWCRRLPDRRPERAGRRCEFARSRRVVRRADWSRYRCLNRESVPPGAAEKTWRGRVICEAASGRDSVRTGSLIPGILSLEALVCRPVYMWLLRRETNLSFGTRPTCRSTALPPLKRITVGMP